MSRSWNTRAPISAVAARYQRIVRAVETRRGGVSMNAHISKSKPVFPAVR
jgi:hypothetical protein